MDTDVLVVGAGPTGLMLANQLGRRGVRAMIIDRHSGPAQQTRAMAVQARTLEIYSKLGIAERALELGKRGTGANMWADGRRMARIPLGDIGKGLSPFPFVLMLGQDDNERIMGEQLRELGHRRAVEHRARRARAACRTTSTATLKQPDGTTRDDHGRVGRRLRRRAQRGARAERHRLSRARPYEHVFFVADTEATGPMVPDELNVYLWRDGFHLFFPMRGDRSLARDRHPAARSCADGTTSTFEDVIPALRQRGGRRACRSRRAAGSRPIASITAAPSASATGAASCSATRRTSTARWAGRA